MGVFHALFEPQRITNAEVRLNEYLRFGLEAGLFFEPSIASRARPVAAYGMARSTSVVIPSGYPESALA